MSTQDDKKDDTPLSMKEFAKEIIRASPSVVSTDPVAQAELEFELEIELERQGVITRRRHDS